MQDVHLMIENLKNGNFNNYVGDNTGGPYNNINKNQAAEATRGQSTDRRMNNDDNASIAG